jgi:hypothetical protein
LKTSKTKTAQLGLPKRRELRNRGREGIPGDLLGDLLVGEDLGGGGALVGGDGHARGGVRIADDEDVVAPAERVAEDGLRVQDHLAVDAGRLARAGSVVIPLGQELGVGHGLRQRARLGAEIGPRPADPDVLGDNLILVLQGEREKLVQGRHGEQGEENWIVLRAHTTTRSAARESSSCGGRETGSVRLVRIALYLCTPPIVDFAYKSARGCR